MKNKILSVGLFLSMFAVGCAESAYTPSATTAGNTIPNNSMYPNPYQPGYPNMPGVQAMPTPYQDAWNHQNQNFQPVMPQQQDVFSWNMRLRNPGFYMTRYRTYNCTPGRVYITHSTPSCMCVKAPCDCDKIIHTQTPVVTHTTSNEPAIKVLREGESLILPIKLEDQDARALYERMAIEEVTLKESRLFSKGSKARISKDYRCVVNGSDRKDSNYSCYIDIRVNDGTIEAQESPGAAGTAEVSATMFQGDNVTIAGQGVTVGEALSPEEGYLKLHGGIARYLFRTMPGTEADGKIQDQKDPNKVYDVKMKVTNKLKCYQSVGTSTIVTECAIKLNATQGTILDAVK